MALVWRLADPILSALIVLLIVYNTRKLIISVLNTLIHDVHVWTITSGNEAFTAHVLVDPSNQGDVDQLTRRMQNMLHGEYGIGHVTVQVEQSLDGCTDNHHVGRLLAFARSER